MKNNNHLEDLIIRYTIDKNDLSASEIKELEESGYIKKESLSLLSDLDTLGELAEDFAPEPARTIEVNKTKKVNKSKNTWPVYLRPALAGSLAFLFIAIVVSTIYKPSISSNTVNLEVVYSEMEKDDLFMNEIDALVESVSYSDLYPDSDSYESGYDFSDEFMEAVVPI